MTHSPTPTELLALKTAHAAEASKDASYDLVSTIVFALGAAQLLQSPESAAELVRLRLLQNAQLAELSEAQIEALSDAGNRALNDHYHEDLCLCSAWPESCVSSGDYFAGAWDTAAFGIGMAAVIGTWESMRVPAEADELVRLRARVAELEAERVRLVADRDAQIIAWLGKKAHEYGYSNATKRAQADAVARMADKLRRGAVPPPEAAAAAELVRADHYKDAARLLEDTGQDDDAVNFLDLQADAIREYAAERQAPLEDPHDSPLHHTYRVGRDLPEAPHA